MGGRHVCPSERGPGRGTAIPCEMVAPLLLLPPRPELPPPCSSSIESLEARVSEAGLCFLPGVPVAFVSPCLGLGLAGLSGSIYSQLLWVNSCFPATPGRAFSHL